MPRTSLLGRATRVEPVPGDQASTTAVSRLAGSAVELVLRMPGAPEVALPVSLVRIVLAAAEELSAGHAVTVLASEVLVTPTEAAELLGLSRPFVTRLMDSGDLPAEHLPGSRHRVVRIADLLEFQARRDRRRTGRQQIADAVEDAGLPY